MLILCSSFLIASCIVNDPLPSFGAIVFLGLSIPVFYLKRHLERRGSDAHVEVGMQPNSLTEIPGSTIDTSSDEEDTSNVTTRHAEM